MPSLVFCLACLILLVSFSLSHPEAPNTGDTAADAFRLEITSQDKDPNKRITREALRIQKTIDGETMDIKIKGHRKTITARAKTTLMNSKLEFNLPNLPGAANRNTRDMM